LFHTFCTAGCGSVVLIVFFPQIALWLPNLIYAR
jgi:TRAP-type C4-dicarboxylate transport system permease large subunit